MARTGTTEMTSRQRDILEFVRKFIEKNHMPPTVREIGVAFNIYPRAVQDFLKILERKGYLKRGNLGARSLILNDLPHESGECCNAAPIIGRIAAGKPIYAEENTLGAVTVNSALLKGRDVYVLQVQGESMMDDGILDGDFVLIRKQETADDGDIVVALLDDEATLKRLYREPNNRIRLQPANKTMQPIYVDADKIRIQGKVVGVQRYFEAAVMPMSS